MVRCVLQYPTDLRCSEIESFVCPVICTEHFRVAFGLSSRILRISEAVGKSMQSVTPGRDIINSLGEKLCADPSWNFECPVFYEGDTIIPFGEYSREALFGANIQSYQEQEDCLLDAAILKRLNTNLLPQRFYGIARNAAESLEVRADQEDQNSQAAVDALAVWTTLTNHVTDYQTTNNLPVIESTAHLRKATGGLFPPYRLSQPMHMFLKRMHDARIRLMPLTGSAARGISTSQALSALKEHISLTANIEAFKLVLAHTFCYAPFPSIPTCASHVETQRSRDILNSLKIDYLRQKKDETFLRRLLRRCLLNQYDESAAGECHTFFMPVVADTLSAKVLSVIRKTVFPMSTAGQVSYSLSTVPKYMYDERRFNAVHLSHFPLFKDNFAPDASDNMDIV